MSFVIAKYGVQSEKTVDGQRKQVIPFVGADSEGEFSQMGVGFISVDDGQGSIWGLAGPHAVIQSWRGMKILERVQSIGQGTLCACWTVARRDMHGSDRHYLDDLAERVGGFDKLQALRDEVLALAPTADEIEHMILHFREKGVQVTSWELEEEVKDGRIATSPLIETIVREAEEYRQAFERKERERKAPRAHESMPKLGFFGRIRSTFR